MNIPTLLTVGEPNDDGKTYSYTDDGDEATPEEMLERLKEWRSSIEADIQRLTAFLEVAKEAR
jgi:hypothetical protein